MAENFSQLEEIINQAEEPGKTPGQALSPDIPVQKTAVLFAFIHGMVELHLSGHNEVSKGLDDAQPLIDLLIESMLG